MRGLGTRETHRATPLKFQAVDLFAFRTVSLPSPSSIPSTPLRIDFFRAFDLMT